jgi:hypothetical protein
MNKVFEPASEFGTAAVETTKGGLGEVGEVESEL